MFLTVVKFMFILGETGDKGLRGLQGQYSFENSTIFIAVKLACFFPVQLMMTF